MVSLSCCVAADVTYRLLSLCVLFVLPVVCYVCRLWCCSSVATRCLLSVVCYCCWLRLQYVCSLLSVVACCCFLLFVDWCYKFSMLLWLALVLVVVYCRLFVVECVCCCCLVFGVPDVWLMLFVAVCC